ncbi:MAG: hypothetical protein VX529_16625 [Pseudomonadota bacterium]|jgi:hypothetical protein|nr:hypothetical protein [Pseudomonadota bacterium]
MSGQSFLGEYPMVLQTPFSPGRRHALIALMGIVIAVLAFALVFDRVVPGRGEATLDDRIARNALAANTLEKDFSSLVRDAYLMAVAPTPERVEAVRVNLDEFEQALAEAEAVAAGNDGHGDTLARLREEWPQLRTLIEARLPDIGALGETGRRDFVDTLARFDDTMDARIETYRTASRAELDAALGEEANRGTDPPDR